VVLAVAGAAALAAALWPTHTPPRSARELRLAILRATAETDSADADAERDQVDWTPEFSRRARGFPVYAALRSLGRVGVAELVDRCCAGAERFAERIVELPGAEVINDVVLNQVLFRFESDERTDEVLHRVQQGGAVWMSGTIWDGRKAIRLSVSNWQTGDAEIDLALTAFGEALKLCV